MTTNSRDRSLRRLLVTAAACLGIAAIVLVMGAGRGRSGSGAAPAPTTTVVSVVRAKATPPTTVQARTQTTRPPTLLERTIADGGSLAVQAAPDGIDVYADPQGVPASAVHFGPTSFYGYPTTLLVVGERRHTSQGSWYRVLLPQRPNGGTGWVRAADVVPLELTYAIRISLAAHRLDLYQQGELRASYPVAVGKPGTTTPTGEFFMVAKVRPERMGGPYGVLAIGLSGFSDTLTDWVGDGQIAIHGTNDPARIGTDASHGCIRMLNEDITLLSGLTPIGTPVVITP